VGFNPFRQQRIRAGDLVLVLVTGAAAVGFVLWAIFAGR